MLDLGPKSRILVVLAVLFAAAIGIGVGVYVGNQAAEAHDAYGYRISVKKDGDDIVFRYQTASGSGYKTVRQFRAQDVREGVWYNGRSQLPNYRARSSSSGTSGSSGSSSTTSAGTTVSGRGSDVKNIRLSEGTCVVRATVSNNTRSSGRGAHASIWIKGDTGAELLLNEIGVNLSDSAVIRVGDTGTYLVEVDAEARASWTVTASCN
ncbi:MAG: hypothetical protein OXN86_14060 [Chloroflexota bacterium]|nr:hypothetical protein [Chloroflexota bacterium]